MKKLTIFIALAFSVYSCKKNEVIPKQNETTVSIAQTTELNEPWEEAENSSNPYDNRGYHHNLLLNAVFADTPTNPSASDIYYLATDYVDKEFNEDITGIVSYNLYSSLYSDLNNSLYSPYNWIENSSASSSVKTALFDLVDIMTDTTIFETENFEYATIKNGIVKWEEEVMGNENFDSTELVNLLTASSIARYSLLYWWGNG